MYKIQNDAENNQSGILCDVHNHSIPLDSANTDYQKVLDDIIKQGADCFDGDIPSNLQTAADNKKFEQQVEDYKVAKARIAQYQLSVGVAESTKTIVTGKDSLLEDITETITIPAIPALDATVEVITQEIDEDPVTSTVANPLVVKDNEERTAAQLVIDNTPQPVKDQVDGV